MKPAAFDWHAPTLLAEALALKAGHGEAARFLAGGQSLVPAMNFRVAQPAVLIDLNRVAVLDHLGFEEDGTLAIGALCRYRRLERDAEVARRLPLLAEALAEVAHPQIRTRGTLGGNLCHADPASEMPAVMLALEARLVLRRAGGIRQVAAAEFFLGPLATALAEDEMLAEIRIPPLPPGSGTAFLEVARRRGDYAMMGVAVVLRRGPDGRCDLARIALCSAGPTPMAAPRAAAALLGQALEPAAFAAAAALAVQEIAPMGSVQASPAYQRHLAGVLLPRALARAAERAA
ncbi:FAD binding domain-containing protein [Falsiroseomonas selenitidurans]|uniref:Xanthine dehydrogenase family protein subunit M n=1 Tax=Falsiroseomonas selenitidurans TaxID=2716335 RepID=A0ABX1DZ15_9PROT|nr:FAD binding domain-containing protein [Falsiroseomonas selenitidurans]NKC30096.1 xanthine dehydrogenase family protein subunit M [Falsiroseomonas selenitidurans]